MSKKDPVTQFAIWLLLFAAIVFVLPVVAEVLRTMSDPRALSEYLDPSEAVPGPATAQEWESLEQEMRAFQATIRSSDG